MNKILIVLTVLIVSSFSFPQQKKKIVFFGDSITQAGAGPGGYITIMKEMLLQKGMDKDYELIGAGISGNKIYDLFFRLETDVLQRDPDMVVIWIGVNDVWHKFSTGTGTDANNFVRFYESIIKKLKE